jgi:hypothetical protein
VVRVSSSDVHDVRGNQVVCTHHGLGFGVWSCGKCFSEPDAASPALLHAAVTLNLRLKGRERMQLRISTLGMLGVHAGLSVRCYRGDAALRSSPSSRSQMATTRFAWTARDSGGGGWRRGRALCELLRPIDFSFNAAQDGG